MPTVARALKTFDGLDQTARCAFPRLTASNSESMHAEIKVSSLSALGRRKVFSVCSEEGVWGECAQWRNSILQNLLVHLTAVLISLVESTFFKIRRHHQLLLLLLC
jgi:hypothetical protein